MRVASASPNSSPMHLVAPALEGEVGRPEFRRRGEPAGGVEAVRLGIQVGAAVQDVGAEDHDGTGREGPVAEVLDSTFWVGPGLRDEFVSDAYDVGMAQAGHSVAKDG